MPQEAWILKCYSCKKFQVQLKKKAKKWKCVVCGAKQDLMTIYFTGQPSDCRVNVQNMNAAEGEILERLQKESMYEDHEDEYNVQNNMHYPSNSCNSLNDGEDFTEEAMAELDRYENEQIQTQQNYSTQQNDFDYEEMHRYEQTAEFSDKINTYYVNDNDGSKKFSIGETKDVPSEEQKQNYQEKKKSIFESECDFDDNLDF